MGTDEVLARVRRDVEDAQQPAPGRAGQDAETAKTLITGALLAELGRRLYELENAIEWHTTCTSCARVLDSAYAETCRREAAEAKVAALRTVLLEGGQADADVRRRALAIIGSEEGAAFARQLVAQAEAADAEYKIAAVRAALYTFLHQHGRSTAPAFKVAIDLASSLRGIIDDLGDDGEGKLGDG